MVHTRLRAVSQTIFCLVLLVTLTIGALWQAPPAHAAATIGSVTTNVSSYPGGQVPKFSKLELTFLITNSSAKNVFYPYTATLPAGMNASSDSGISVTGVFTSPSGAEYKQPGFFFQDFQQAQFNSDDWLYPTSEAWKVRFAPNEVGTWQYKVTVTDSSGTASTTNQSFTVSPSSNKGFIRTSAADTRYMEYDDGSLFTGIGFNQALGHINPSANASLFATLKQNSVKLVRVWLSQHSIFGSAWGLWYSHNPLFQTQEPTILFSHPADARVANYPGLVPPTPIAGHDVYLWLNGDESYGPAGAAQPNYNPCQMLGWEQRSAKVPLETNTNYRVRARYNMQLLEGPKVEGKPYGFAIKSGGWLWNSDPKLRCYSADTGTVLAATYPGPNWSTYPDPQNPGWMIVEGTFNSQQQHFIDHLYLTIENAASKDSDQVAGHVYVDQVWVEESLGNNQFGPNLVFKPIMGMHTYVNQRDAFALDKNLELAEQNGVYIKGVLNEKNDFILASLKFDGTISPTKTDSLFFGNGRETSGKTKVRFLQEAWWRYAQARWGYSPNIQSWELLNEGPDGMTNHHILTDEFGKFMHCRAFGVDPGNDCTYNHPNDHLVTTSFSNSKFPILFWKNASGSYPDIDVADIHLYAFEGTSANFNDEAAFSKDQSMYMYQQQLNKPIIRGETGWQFSSTDQFGNNVTNGLWLHNFLWAGLNSGGLIEHYWNGAPTQNQMVKNDLNGNLSHDHRDEYIRYFAFIENLPLNNGKYVDAAATSGDSNLRAWGQKDTTNNRAHLWIQNAKHTWKNVADSVSIAPISTTVSIGGFSPNKALKVEWWNTATGSVSSTQSISTNASGTLNLPISNLDGDVAVKIGTYDGSNIPPSPLPSPVASPIPSPSPSPICNLPTLAGDLDNSGKVTVLDLTALVGQFGSTSGSGDLNCDGAINFKDVSLLLGNLGK